MYEPKSELPYETLTPSQVREIENLDRLPIPYSQLPIRPNSKIEIEEEIIKGKKWTVYYYTVNDWDTYLRVKVNGATIKYVEYKQGIRVVPTSPIIEDPLINEILELIDDDQNLPY